MKAHGVSIVICCHNGAGRLPETIRHIAMQKVAGISWELLIVDNCSTDHSVRVAQIEWYKYRVDNLMRIVSEPVPGLTHARARGFEEANYEYVILCDDDNWLEQDYVANTFHILSENPNIGALGGCGKLVYEAVPTFPELSYIFAAGPQASRSGKARENKLYGAGCAIRYSAYRKLLDSGFKSQLTDRTGAALTSGGDYEVCLAIAVLGYDICYDERLKFTHFITRERLTWEYFLRYAYESTKGFNIITSYKWVLRNSRLNRYPTLLVLRNFLTCARIFLSLRVRRIITRRDTIRRCLYFRQQVFRYKLMEYFVKFDEFVSAHRKIVKFRDNCCPSQQVLKPVVGKPSWPLFSLSSFAKPSRPLQ